MMMRALIPRLVILLFFVCLRVSFAEADPWHLSLKSRQSLQQNLGHLYQFKADRYKHFPVRLTVAVLNNGDYRAQLEVQKRQTIKPLREIAEQHHAIIATNGGFYRENFLVNGLLINQGKIQSKLVQNRLLSTIISINRQGQIELGKREKTRYQSTFNAFQSGPILLENNRVKKLDNRKHAARVIYALTNHQCFIITLDDATLEQSAFILKSLAKYFSVNFKLAVNFDGGEASAYFFKGRDYPMIKNEWLPVKMILMFFPPSV